MTVGDLLGNPSGQTPLLVVIATGLLGIAGFIGKRAAASMQRQGARLGRLEILVEAEQTRRRQLEECLRSEGFRLPYWPGDPAALYRPPPPRYVDEEDQAPAAPETDWMPTQDFSRHRIRGTS